MKRFALIVMVSLPAFALTPLTRGNRIGVLRMSEQFAYGAEQAVARSIGRNLQDELSSRGFDAFDARATFEEIRRGVDVADYYIEIVSSDATHHPVGSVMAGLGPVGVDVGVVVSRVAAELRLYDGRTLELLERYDLRDTKTAVMPTGVGLGGRAFWAYIALPFAQRAQHRSAAREVARQAADRIASR